MERRQREAERRQREAEAARKPEQSFSVFFDGRSLKIGFECYIEDMKSVCARAAVKIAFSA